MINEIDKLLQELRNMKSAAKKVVLNNADTWRCIANKDWAGAGFSDEEEAKQFILDNPYSNI